MSATTNTVIENAKPVLCTDCKEEILDDEFSSEGGMCQTCYTQWKE